MMFMATRTILLLTGFEIESFSDTSFTNIIGYFDGIFISVLLTYGFVSMVNQRLNADLDTYVHELKAANEIKDKFYRIIAHDLRSPFNILINLSEVIAEDHDSLSADELKKFCISLNTAVKSQFNLLTDLLNWTRIQTKAVYMNPEDISLFQLVNEHLKEIEWISSSKSIHINNCVTPDTRIFVDREMIKIVLRNLVANAIKFSGEGGMINIFSKKEDGLVNISINDSGVGIAPENLQKLLKDVPVSTNGTANEKGTGLGLMLCKEIVEQHNGKFNIQSEVGKGSTFTFSLPASKDQG